LVFFVFQFLDGLRWLLTKTWLGLFVRAVTQNRTMARRVGVPTARVETGSISPKPKALSELAPGLLSAPRSQD
jgi:branched-subunit amino acid ABC-type transport system permease component